MMECKTGNRQRDNQCTCLTKIIINIVSSKSEIQTRFKMKRLTTPKTDIKRLFCKPILLLNLECQEKKLD